MIGRLRGTLELKQPPLLLVDVQGVGYELEAPLSTIERLPEIGAVVILHTHLIVRDDAHALYGFATPEERALFRDLLRVNGIGARIALAILSGIDINEFARCIAEGDSTNLTRLPGIGKKTAERLIIEMRDRIGHLSPTITALQSTNTMPPANTISDAISALISLGYRPPDANRLVHAVKQDGLSTAELIRRALQSTF